MGGRGGNTSISRGLWVVNAAILATNAAIISALDPDAVALVVMAVVTAFLALGSAMTARAMRGPGTEVADATRHPLPEIERER